MPFSMIFKTNMDAWSERYNVEDELLNTPLVLKKAMDHSEVLEGMISERTDSECARNWALPFCNLEIYHTFYLVGFGGGEYIRALLSVTDSSHKIYILEPDWKHFLRVMMQFDLSDLLRSERVAILFEELQYTVIPDIIQASVDYTNYSKISFGVIPGYETCRRQYDYLKQTLAYAVNMVMYTKITELQLARMIRENIIHNIPDGIGQKNVTALIDCISNRNSNVPAVLVSAGPSLDKNIGDLKKAQGHAFIIVVDTAVKAVQRAGIQPDLMICVDPRKELELFEGSMSSIPAVFGLSIPYKVVDGHKGIHFYAGGDDIALLNDFLKEGHKEEYSILEAGGSVANAAFSLLKRMGFARIILVGQDLAFTGGRGHTKDAYDDEAKNAKDSQNEALGLLYVEGIDGRPVQTESRMKSYIEWFERAIAMNPQIDVIDATEGGALIHGSRIMPLQEAINQYGTEDSISFTEAIHTIPDAFSIGEQDELRSYFNQSSLHLDQLDAELRKSEDSYEELLRIARSGDLRIPMELKESLSYGNQVEERNPWMSLVRQYAKEAEYETEEAMPQAIGAARELESIAMNTLHLLHAYREGIAQLKKDLPCLTERL